MPPDLVYCVSTELFYSVCLYIRTNTMHAVHVFLQVFQFPQSLRIDGSLLQKLYQYGPLWFCPKNIIVGKSCKLLYEHQLLIGSKQLYYLPFLSPMHFPL